MGQVFAGAKLLAAFEGKLEEVYPTVFEQATDLKATVPAVASDAVIQAKGKSGLRSTFLSSWYQLQYDSAKGPLNRPVPRSSSHLILMSAV